MNESSYPYAKGNLLEERNTYFYSSFEGRDFLRAWHRSREAVLSDLPVPQPPQRQCRTWRTPVLGEQIETSELFGFLLAKLDSEGEQGFSAIRFWIDRILQRFEVTKRIYDAYNSEFRAAPGSSFRRLELYVSYAELMIAAQLSSRELPYLNALLKVVDTLSAMHPDLDIECKRRLAWIIHQETALVDGLAARLKVLYAA